MQTEQEPTQPAHGRKFSSAAAQGFAGQDGTESVMQRKQAFRPEPCRALLQPLDILHARVQHICRKLSAAASQGRACRHETQSVGTDMRAASFHPDLFRQDQSPVASHAE